MKAEAMKLKENKERYVEERGIKGSKAEGEML